MENFRTSLDSKFGRHEQARGGKRRVVAFTFTIQRCLAQAGNRVSFSPPFDFYPMMFSSHASSKHCQVLSKLLPLHVEVSIIPNFHVIELHFLELRCRVARSNPNPTQLNPVFQTLGRHLQELFRPLSNPSRGNPGRSAGAPSASNSSGVTPTPSTSSRTSSATSRSVTNGSLSRRPPRAGVCLPVRRCRPELQAATTAGAADRRRGFIGGAPEPNAFFGNRLARASVDYVSVEPVHASPVVIDKVDAAGEWGRCGVDDHWPGGGGGIWRSRVS